MESTGVRGKIQISQTTADLLISSGKVNWLSKREDAVCAKGKGVMETYFVSVHAVRRASGFSAGTFDSSVGTSISDESSERNDEVESDRSKFQSTKTGRLIEWCADIMQNFLRQIVARRDTFGSAYGNGADLTDEEIRKLYAGERVLGDAKEIITLPVFQKIDHSKMEDPRNIVLDPIVVNELREFLTAVVERYNDNPVCWFLVQLRPYFGAEAHTLVLHVPSC